MTPAHQRKLALCILVCVVALNAIGLSAELSVGAVNGSDNIAHWTLLQEMVRAAGNGDNPLDFWSPEASFGAPTVRTYQPLAHALVALTYFVFGKSVSLMTVFLWIRYLAVVLLPVGFFAAARMLDFEPITAAAASVMAPLLSTDALYGLDYSSYVSSGRGLFPQSVVAVFLLLAIGAGYRAVRDGRRWAVAGLLTGLTCVCHFIYGWIAAVTISLAALLPDERARLATRLRRLIAIGGVSLVVSLFQILPVLIDGPILNHSRWEGQWRWDSFGAGPVMRLLFTGELLDHGRPPVLSLLALAGVAWIIWTAYDSKRLAPSSRFVLAGAILWILVFFGRATWGPLVLLVGATRDLHLHRAIGAVQVFLVLLAALGLVVVCRELARRVHVAAAMVLLLLCLAMTVRERTQYLAQNETRGSRMVQAYAAEQNAVEAVISKVQQADGRVYAGLGTTWGPKFNIAGIPFFAFLNMSLVPQTSASYSLLPLTSEIEQSFDESRPAEYRLFNIRSVVAPADRAPALPGFLAPRESFGRYRIFDAPATGYFDVVTVPASVAADKDSFYQINDRWLKSDWPEKKAHLWLDFGGEAPRGLRRIAPDEPLGSPVFETPAGEILSQRHQGAIYEADVEMTRPAVILFKMTWHPKWVAELDSRPQQTAMLSPGFIGIPVAAGRHKLRLRYAPGMWKLWMALGGLITGLLLACWAPALQPAEAPAMAAPIQLAAQATVKQQKRVSRVSRK